MMLRQLISNPLLFDDLVALLQESQELHSLIADSVFAQFVQELMRHKAMAEAISPDVLLQDATELATQSLARALEEMRVTADFEPYVGHCQKRLRPIAKELSDLSYAAAQREPLPEESLPVAIDSESPYQISRITVGSYLDGLLAVNVDGATFRMDAFKTKFRLPDEAWFPFLVEVDELSFIVERSCAFTNLKTVSRDDWPRVVKRLTSVLDVAFQDLN